MTFIRVESEMPCSAADLFRFHTDSRNLAAITPPIPPFRVLGEPKLTEVGDSQALRLGWKHFGFTWIARVERVETDALVQDVQLRGPFRRWRHRHRFTATSERTALLTDTVSFRLFPGRAGEFLEYFTVRPMVLGLFAYRHRTTRRLLTHHNH